MLLGEHHHGQIAMPQRTFELQHTVMKLLMLRRSQNTG